MVVVFENFIGLPVSVRMNDFPMYVLSYPIKRIHQTRMG